MEPPPEKNTPGVDVCYCTGSLYGDGVVLVQDGGLANGLLRKQSVPECLFLAESTENFVRGQIVKALELSKNRRDLAAKFLGISRVTLYNKMRKVGLLPPLKPH